MRKSFVTIGVALALAATQFASATPVEFSASGSRPADIQDSIAAFRGLLGTNHLALHGDGNVFTDGRREINWDGVPDTVAAPNLMPPDFFNKNSPRGAVFFTPGTGFEISAKEGNATGTPVEFGDITGGLRNQFQTFSPQRLFTALDSSVTETLFFVPGTSTPATVTAFGSVFTNVRKEGLTTIDYLDANGGLLHRQIVPASKRSGLSFAGTMFTGEKVFMVRITSGNVELDREVGLLPNPRGDDPVDVVVMDDFIYAEPQAAATP
ncbi:MAG TPA: hypothetical protein VFL07_15460 [Rudaea sp.]|nr:hypothetical protein [Rudaea sp.]HSC10681.1 hypothetical protein [Rhodanobacteraceae bacterium]